MTPTVLSAPHHLGATARPSPHWSAELHRRAGDHESVGPGHLPTVCVWRVDVTDGRHEEFVAATYLTDAERLRASLGTDVVRRRRILLRGALRQVLSGLLAVPPARVPLAEDAGRPLLPADRGLHFSCSASGRVGLVAVAVGSDVGVDVQEHRDEDARAATAEGWLTTAEQRVLSGLPRADRLRATTRCWTQKEAVLKGLGLGLRQAPVTVATPVAPAGRIGEWWAAPVAVRSGHVASVVVRTPQDEVDLVVRDLTVGEI